MITHSVHEMLNWNISLLSQSNAKFMNKILIPHHLFPGSHMVFFTELIELTVNRKKGLYLVKLWKKKKKYVLHRTFLKFCRVCLCDILSSVSLWHFLRLLESHCIVFCNIAWQSTRNTTWFMLSQCNVSSRQLWKQKN